MTKCLDVYKNLNVLAKGGVLGISPCCVSPTKLTNFVDFEGDNYLNEVRQTWDDGVMHSACSACSRVPNRMTGSNAWYAANSVTDTNVELIKLDYWTGDLCNLRCAICGPDNSSAWQQELGINLSKTIVNKFWTTLDLSKLKLVHFNGGEPLLSKEHTAFLQSLPNKDQIEINYNTNGTILPSVTLISLWEQFRLVRLDFSIDDIGPRFEYQRYPAKWDEVAKNLQWVNDNAPVNCMFAINTTVSKLNQSNLPKLDLWLQQHFSSNRLGDLTEHRKQPAFGIFAIDQDIDTMLKFLDKCDARRGTNWKETFPELTKE